MPSIGKIQVDVSKAIAAIKKRMDALRTESKRELGMWAENALMRFRLERLSGRPGLKTVSGKLARSLRHEERGRSLADLTTRLLSARSVCGYAHVHENAGGTTITAKGKRLAVPIPGGPALRENGEKVYRGPAQARTKFHVVKSGGRAFLVDRKGRFWYTLRNSVYIPERLHFKDSIRGYSRWLRDNLAAAFRSIM